MTTLPDRATPEAPRPVTPKARRRAWAEPQVRSWLLLTAGLLLGAIILAIGSTVEWIDESRVVRKGEVIKAVAWHAGGARVQGMPLANGSPVDIEYEYKGTKYKATGVLQNTGDEYNSLEPFDIRIDPEAPAIWTNRRDVPPMVEKMMGVGIMMSVAAVCGAAALLLRWRCIALWVDGDMVNAQILGHGQSALAPQSVVLRCAVRVGKSERLMTVYVPQQDAPAEGKQTIALIVSHGRSRAVAVVNYHP